MPTQPLIYGCLDQETEILSKDKWKSYQNMKMGDPVMAFDIDTLEFREEIVQEVIIYSYDDDGFHLQGDDHDQLVSLNHRVIIGGDDGKPTIVFAEDLPDEVYVFNINWIEGDEFFVPEYVPAKVTKLRYTGVVWCIKVPSGAFIARRKGKSFITGNSGGMTP